MMGDVAPKASTSSSVILREQGPSQRSRPVPRLWASCLLGVALLMSQPRAAQGQLTPVTCRAKLTAGDRNGDGLLDKVEYINFLLSLSPYSPVCPDLGVFSDFLTGAYFEVLETTSCYCLDYDSLNCCDTPQLRVPGTYPGVNDEEYIGRVCADVIDVIERKCTGTNSPTAAPTGNIVERPSTATPTSAPTATPTANGSANLDVPPVVEGRGQSEKKTWRDKWLRIALPFFGVAFLACVLLLIDTSRREKRKRKLVLAKSLAAEDDDSLRGYPEVLEETENYDETEKSMEEGRIREVAAPLVDPSRRSSKNKKSSKSSSRNTSASKSRKSSASQSLAQADSLSSLRRNIDDLFDDDADDHQFGDLPDTRRNSLPPPDSPQRMSRFLDSLALDDVAGSSSANSSSNVAPAPADSRTRMGTFFKESDASSAGTADFFVDEQDDDMSAVSDSETGNQIQWRLLDPTTLVHTGAVEVFPLPPVTTTKSSSASSQEEESKEDLYSDYDDSVTDMYVVEASEGTSEWREFNPSQPDPDGVRLEDGRQYREAWSR